MNLPALEEMMPRSYQDVELYWICKPVTEDMGFYQRVRHRVGTLDSPEQIQALHQRMRADYKLFGKIICKTLNMGSRD